MTLDEAMAETGAFCQKVEADEIAGQLADMVGLMLADPAIPMLARVAACLSLVAGSAEGLMIVIGEGAKVEQMHRADLVPDIATALRAAATIYEEIAKGGN